MTRIPAAFLSIAAFACLVGVAQASQILYSSFPASSTNSGTFAGVLVGGGKTNGTGLINADEFSPTESGYLAQIQIEAKREYGGNALIVNLAEDAGGVPGTIMEKFLLFGQLPPNTPSVAIANSFEHSLLLAGKEYWIELSVPDLNNDAVAWAFSASTAPAVVATQFTAEPGVWFVGSSDSGGLETFALSGTPANIVPEPREVWPVTLSSFALCGLAVIRRLWSTRAPATDSLP